ncbi:MAG: 3'-5' exonuclease [Sphingomonadales bacterium]|jgi:DNA polymerase III epsilon subunit-like protein
MPDVAIDIETSAFSPDDGGEIIRLSCRMLPGPGRQGRKFDALVKPRNGVPTAVASLTGISSDMLQNVASFDEIAGPFLSFIGDGRLVSIGSEFERAFINHALTKAGYQVLPDYRFHDLWDEIPLTKRGHGTSALLSHLGIEQDQLRKGAQTELDLIEHIYWEMRS